MLYVGLAGLTMLALTFLQRRLMAEVGAYRHQSAYDREKSLLLYSTVKVGLSVLL